MRAGAPRRWLSVGSALTVLGLALLATAPVAVGEPSGAARAREMLGGTTLVAGWLILAWAIHRMGREG